MRFVERHPYWFVAILEIIVIAVYLMAGTIAHGVHLSNQAITGVANSTLSLLAIGTLSVLGWWPQLPPPSPMWHPRRI
jgi:hypothetical protein